jgi:hypothetical protein
LRSLQCGTSVELCCGAQALAAVQRGVGAHCRGQ